MTIRHQVGNLGVALLLSVGAGHVCSAQEQGAGPAASETASDKDNASSKTDVPAEANAVTKTSQGTPTGLVRRFADDQRNIWTSPARLRFSDAEWLVPLSGITAGLFVTDRQYSKQLSQNPTTIRHYKTLSNGGVAALVGGAGGMWVLGHVKHNEHWSETGFLAGEAALNSLVMVEELKYSLRRERPFQGDGSGSFFQNGGTSFPSEHAAAAWSVAGVIAHEYPGPFTKIMAYGLASLVDISRVRARQHFPSDVLVGSMIGNLVAQNIYSRHHDLDLGGGEWRSISQIFRGDGNLSPANLGSPYVPLDSWTYPVFDRLVARGFINSAMLGQRPWTRLECAHLVAEAADELSGSESDSPRLEISLHELQTEFAKELKIFEGTPNEQLRIESVYTRMSGINGQPLADSYHFGQTLINDFGRPYQEGFSNVSGFSAYATEGRYSVYVRGEYQHAPSAPAFSLPVRQVISTVDLNPLQPASPIAEANQFNLLDAYVGTTLENWEFTFGKQSLWWGTGRGGAFLFSDNADPIYMFRASRIRPFTIPLISKLLGPVKLDMFYGQLSGNQFPPRPLIHGEKVSFKPTPNLEVGFSRTSEFGGVGRPLTLGAIWNSYVAFVSSVNYRPSVNPGKRTGGFEFSYRVPFVRDWLTVYADSLSPDDPSPLASPARAAVSTGLYMPRIPGLPKLDFRFESVYTNTPRRDISSGNLGGQYVYWELFYHELYTNKKNIIGSWIGRDGQGFQAWSKYSFSPRNTLQLGYRHAQVDSDFIPGGETVNDGSIKLDLWLRHDFSLSTFVQYEKWLAPLLAQTPQTNWTSSVQIAFWPRSWTK
jgi:membrane-associated phospholipid phosphatase